MKIKELAEKLAAAKTAKDFALADKIREQIDAMWRSVADSEDGWSLIKKRAIWNDY